LGGDEPKAEIASDDKMSEISKKSQCKQYPKMCPSAYGVSGRSNLHQNLPWTGGNVPAKFN